MLDIAISYNRYKFIGYEFLTWLWFATETKSENLIALNPEMTHLTIGNRIVLENRAHKTSETITIKGDDADLKEGILALNKGALVVELQLIYQSDHHEWLFTLKGESLSYFNLKLPQTGPLESKEDIEGLVLEKVYLIEKLMKGMDKLYTEFIRFRLHSKWSETIVPEMKAWIGKRSR
jgi:hypothetical protein